MVGAWRFDGSCASGTVPAADASLGFHWKAPAGLLVSSHSYLNRFSRKLLSHFTGLVVHAPSRPLLMVLTPLPSPKLLLQPRPCSSIGAPSGSRPTYLLGSAAPWVLPKVCPPAMRATVSSSSIAIRAKVSRISLAAATGSGLPLGPSGFT